MELNDRQKEAIETIDGPVLVIAGAGSGKTRVLTERIAHIIETGAAKPWEVLAITFTNKAAAEMKRRIEERADFETRDMWISTFHSMCVRMLRKYADFLGYTSNFIIYDVTDTERLLKSVFEDLGLKDNESEKLTEKSMAKVISKFKNSDQTEEFGKFAAARLPISPYDAEHAFETYESRLRSQNAMDFDDLLQNAYYLLSHEEEPRRFYQDKFRYILIDEYQDTNPTQYRIVKLLAEGHGNLFAVGDDDQSIYAFRGATIRNILEFEQDFPNAKVIRLEQNYRSTRNILSVANAIIRNNQNRRGKELWSDIESDDVPLVYTAKDEREEASFICQDIRKQHEDGMPYSTVSVLYRTRTISRLLEEKLNNNGIPYRVYGGQSFYDRKEIKDMVAYLNIIASPQSDVSLLRIINIPKRGIGEMKLAQLKRVVDENQISYLDVLSNSGTFIKDKVLGKKAAEFCDMYRDISDNYENLSVREIVERVYERTGYKRMLEEEKTAESKARMENIEELIRGAAEYDEIEGGGFIDYLQKVTLMTDQDRDNGTGDVVTLMTMHAAKGLEFDSVYIAGMVENVFPSQKSIEEKLVEEERRLCYVAVTRARKRLVMVGSHYRRAFGRPQQSELSRFIREIPEDLIKIVDPQKEAQEKAQSQPKRFMANTAANRKARPEPKFFTGGDIVVPKAKTEIVIGAYREGLRVRHALFGNGTITKLEETQDGSMAVVEYETEGPKTMMLAYASLEILE